MKKNPHEEMTLVALALSGKKSGEGYLCNCPCHDDKTPSLSINVANDKLLYHCHAGCSKESLTEAIGKIKTMSQLAPIASAPAKPAKKLNKKLVAKYEYENEDGSVAFVKLKYEVEDGSKTYRFQTTDLDGTVTWKKPKGYNRLYQQNNLPTWIAKGKAILICEGEKDVDSMLSLGLAAVTNYEGGANWKASYAENFVSANVIVLEDNDSTGYKRTETIVGSLAGIAKGIKVCKFPELEPHGDVTDYLKLYGKDQTKTKLAQAKPVGTQTLDDMQQASSLCNYEKPEDQKKAGYHDYIQFLSHITRLEWTRRDVLSGEVLCKWQGETYPVPIANSVPTIASYMSRYGSFFGAQTRIKEHIAAWQETQEAELCIDVPKWDGRDRLREIADVCRFTNVSSEHFYELICQWGADIFRRLADPYVQPVCPVFQGSQGIGKDVLVQALCCGFQFYFKELRIEDQRDLTEASKQLHTALIFNFNEFDKTAKLAIASLKSLITKSETNERLPYQPTSQLRACRASFIATCNAKDILVDATGNRRFQLFECEYLGMETVTKHGRTVGTGKPVDIYPGMFADLTVKASRAQIIAQYRALCDSGFRASLAAQDAMREVVEDATPDSLELMVQEDFDHELRAFINSSLTEPDHKSGIDNQPLYHRTSIAHILNNICKTHNVSQTRLLRLLGPERKERRSSGRLYRLPANVEPLCPDDNDLEIMF